MESFDIIYLFTLFNYKEFVSKWRLDLNSQINATDDHMPSGIGKREDHFKCIVTLEIERVLLERELKSCK